MSDTATKKKAPKKPKLSREEFLARKEAKRRALTDQLNKKQALRTEEKKVQPFDFYLVLDLEGKLEIIEFPVVVINSSSESVECVFHRYVLPKTIEKELLTKIISSKYGSWNLAETYWEEAIPFDQVLSEFLQFLETKVYSKSSNIAFVTCGNWDIKTQVPHQCKISGLELPKYFNSWINIKEIFTSFYGKTAHGMKEMLSILTIPLEGNHHSGIDDANNIAKIASHMIKNGSVLDITGRHSEGI